MKQCKCFTLFVLFVLVLPFVVWRSEWRVERVCDNCEPLDELLAHYPAIANSISPSWYSPEQCCARHRRLRRMLRASARHFAARDIEFMLASGFCVCFLFVKL